MKLQVGQVSTDSSDPLEYCGGEQITQLPVDYSLFAVSLARVFGVFPVQKSRAAATLVLAGLFSELTFPQSQPQSSKLEDVELRNS